MSEPIEWVFQAGTSCAYCKEGLCQRMNQLMEDGMSQRKAADVMAEESGGKWTAAGVRRLFNNFMVPTGTTPAKPKAKEAEPKGGDDRESSHSFEFGAMEAPQDFCDAFESFYQQVQNAKLEKWGKTPKETALKCVKMVSDLITF